VKKIYNTFYNLHLWVECKLKNAFFNLALFAFDYPLVIIGFCIILVAVAAGGFAFLQEGPELVCTIPILQIVSSLNQEIWVPRGSKARQNRAFVFDNYGAWRTDNIMISMLPIQSI
jgi:hypothetical protein